MVRSQYDKSIYKNDFFSFRIRPGNLHPETSYYKMHIFNLFLTDLNSGTVSVI